MDSNKKPRYNLSLVIQETGVKADTIRAWERRYQLPQPGRSEGGQRLFSDYDIATIKWLQSRQSEGMRISQAVELWREILSDGQDPLIHYKSNQIQIPLPNKNDLENQSITDLEQAWVDNILRFNGTDAEQILSQAFAQFPLEIVCLNLLQAGLEKIGQGWYTNQISVQQEHYASEIAIKKLQALISAAPHPNSPQKILVGCPPGEFHSISALMITLLLRYRGWDVIYLGANIPTDQIVDTVSKINPSLVIMTATSLKTAASLLETYQLLKSQDTTLLFGGHIFTINTDLPRRITGHYLADDLSNIVPKIENLIFDPTTKNIRLVLNDHYSKISKIFLKNKSKIEVTAEKKIGETQTESFHTIGIQDIIGYLTDDINAALALGDLDLIRTNLDWIRGLLINREVPPEFLSEFYYLYLSAVQEHLEGESKPILDWFESNSSFIIGSKN